MNSQRSPAARGEDDGLSSPKRKKVRSKYAPKACVSCRRSKLKCSGENPCQRCLDNGKRCFYSEDQTAAEALQNLSRPTPAPPSLAPHGTNGNGLNRRNMLPQQESVERRASDASVLGMSMEARMARIEGMMESLVQERSLSAPSRGSTEYDEAISDGLLSDIGVQAARDLFGPALTEARRPSSQLASPERTRQSMALMSPSNGADSSATIRVGSYSYPFPDPTGYQNYMELLFNDLTGYYPCINEAEFRMRSAQMLAAPAIHDSDVCFLALHYAAFACCHIATDPVSAGQKLPGWQWFETANDLAGRKELSGKGDLSLIQYLILKAVYLVLADLPNEAYNATRILCGLCFQFGLHQQSSWRNYTPFEIHMRQRIFWTAYVLDRKVSLSCGRPYGIRESSIDIEQPAYLFDKDIHPDQPLPDPDLSRSSNMFLNSMVCWGRLSADVWDGLFDAAVVKGGFNSENAHLLDAQIQHWTEVILPSIALLPTDYPPNITQARQHHLVHTRLGLLRLFVYRQLMVTLTYDGERGRICGEIAIDLVRRVREHGAETDAYHTGDDGSPSPHSFGFHMATTLASALLILATLCVRDLDHMGLSWKVYADSFTEGWEIICHLSMKYTVAQRIHNELVELARVVTKVVEHRQKGLSFPYNLIPAQVRDLMPCNSHNSLDFAQQSGGSGTFSLNTDRTQEPDKWGIWESSQKGHRVLWI